MKKELIDYMFRQKETDVFHTPGSLENQMANAIASGNIAQLKAIFELEYEGKFGTLSLNKERQERYLFVSAAAVFSRAAMRGGMDYELACSMADVYCQKMDQMPLSSDFFSLMIDMGIDFCQTICDTNRFVYSPLINDCCSYIHKHTHESVSLAVLSQLSNMCTRSLSKRFLKETGQSIVDYIQLSKIDEAKVLILYTTKTLVPYPPILPLVHRVTFRVYSRNTPALLLPNIKNTTRIR
jgi:YesN/AraC family two-component response regulator